MRWRVHLVSALTAAGFAAMLWYALLGDEKGVRALLGGMSTWMVVATTWTWFKFARRK